MKYQINYLHKFFHQSMWREKHEVVTLEEMSGVLKYMEQNSQCYKLVSVVPVA